MFFEYTRRFSVFRFAFNLQFVNSKIDWNYTKNNKDINGKLYCFVSLKGARLCNWWTLKYVWVNKMQSVIDQKKNREINK